MFYRICDNIALRSWMFVPAAYYVEGELPARRLLDAELSLLMECDGEHDLIDVTEGMPFAPDEETKLLRGLYTRKLIEPCEKGQAPGEWSRFRRIPHRHFPKACFMITGKCNYNCIHCFNAADNAPLMSEWSYEDTIDLLDQLAEAGVHWITISGGEPMVHPRIMDVIRAIYERHMFVGEFNTNGHFITEEFLDELIAMGAKPLFKISYDGIGVHDWMRNREGADKDTLSAIKLCIEKGFEVMIQMQVHKKSVPVIVDTAKLLNEMGVSTLRLIRTTEVPRWKEAAGDACISLEDYYQQLPVAVREIYDYLKSLPKRQRHIKRVIVWQLLELYPDEDSYRLVPLRFCQGEYKDTMPVCAGNRGMISITSEGDLVPCLQMSGLEQKRGLHHGNLHEHSLKDLLTDGNYLRIVTQNLYQLRQENHKCNSCEFFPYCAGGCRALGFLNAQEPEEYYVAEDLSKCLFFKGGWYQRTVEAMGDLTNKTPLPQLSS